MAIKRSVRNEGWIDVVESPVPSSSEPIPIPIEAAQNDQLNRFAEYLNYQRTFRTDADWARCFEADFFERFHHEAREALIAGGYPITAKGCQRFADTFQPPYFVKGLIKHRAYEENVTDGGRLKCNVLLLKEKLLAEADVKGFENERSART